MKKLHKQLTALTASFALMVSMVSPAMASTYSFNVTGNGSDSENEIKFEVEREAAVFQSNVSSVVNNIQVSSNTGGNSVSDNTGGDVDVRTGDTQTSVKVENSVGSNVAQVVPCDCETDTEVKVSGNGTNSENEVKIESKNKTLVTQENMTSLINKVGVESNTGNNTIDDNTGGSVRVTTGDVKVAPVQIKNMAGSNIAMVGGGHSGASSDMSLKIMGNGSHSENEIEVEFENEVELYQGNAALILNELYLAGITGENSVSDNTGEATTDPSLTTGDVTIKAYIENAAGFNYASADCGCVLGVDGQIAENGTESENEIELEIEDELLNVQENEDMIVNAGAVEGLTGDNYVDDNTSGEVNVRTGDSMSEVHAHTMGGSNIFGSFEIELPWGWGFLLSL